MSLVRSKIDRDVEQVAEKTRQLKDWKYHVRAHPWVAISAVAAVGFFAVPRKTSLLRPDPQDLARLARNNQLVLSKPGKVPQQKSMARAAAVMIGNVLARTALTYLSQQLGKRTGEQAAASQEFHRPTSPR